MIKQFAKRCVALIVAAGLVGTQPGAALWAAGQAALEGVEVQPDEITVHLSERVQFNIFTTAEPPRLVLELMDTEHAADPSYKEGMGRFLTRVRSGQYQREPDLVSRVVLYLKKLVAYRAKWDDTRLKVRLEGLSEDVEAAAPAPVP
ncbi:MAG: AMIN domain-containing protein, partial [Elusimicrobiota bacterium]